jgi:TonB family protein
MFKPTPAAKFILTVLSILALNSAASAQNSLTAKANTPQPQPSTVVESDRLKDGLAGPVRRVRIEVAKLANANGQTTEEKRVVLETTAYDIKGTKTENRYFPVAGSTLTGKEVYKYDERGNISEMTLLNQDGTLLGKEVYKYDYDSVGNWTRMTTSVAVVEGGKITYEPTEVTYRSIMYYLDENVLKLAQPASSAVADPAKTIKVESKTSSPAAAEVKPQSNKPVENRVVSSQLAPSLPAVNISNNRLTTGSASALSDSKIAPSQVTMVAVDSPPPPANTPRPLLKPVSGGVLNGKALFLPAPSYPDAAKRMRAAGVVTVEVVVDETGKVISAQATSGPAILREVAVQAAVKAKFSATMLSGSPVKVTGLINYRFSLAQ